MIPDFPDLKNKIIEKITGYFDVRAHQALGPFAYSPKYIHHEGDKWRNISNGLSSESLEYQHIQAYGEIHIDEVPDLTFDKLFTKMESIINDMSSQLVKYHFSKLFEAVEVAENTVDARGKEITQDLYLELLEKVDIDFDEKGEEPINLAFFMSSELFKEFTQRSVEWEKDEEFTNRHANVINKKKEEWRARESLRKLVD